jgi:hypothetical protein
MLTLAAIAYRGFELVQLDPHKSTLMYEAMAGCLRELGPVKDQWDIVWGPASFSPFGLGFADTAVYVAQYRRKRSTFAVAVRGTNPVVFFDWLFDDFMVTKQMPWSYGNSASDCTIRQPVSKSRDSLKK